MDAMERAVAQVIEAAKFRPDFLPERFMERFVADLAREFDLAGISLKVQQNVFRRLATEASGAADKCAA